ncbi:25764_t:CDS:1, partial [Dentiscutata erythropus]
SIPNSHQKIEPELMHHIFQEITLEEHAYCTNNTKGFDLLPNEKTVRSLALIDQFEAEELNHFFQISQNIESHSVSGTEDFPGNFMNPTKLQTPITKELLNCLI